MNRICAQLKMQVVKRGGIGMRALAITLCKAANGELCLDAEDFEAALKSFNLFPSVVELQALCKAFPSDEGAGMVSYENFVERMRDPLVKRRETIVCAAWCKIDEAGKGGVTTEQIFEAYDVSLNQDFMDKRCSKEEIVGQFFMGFDLSGQGVRMVS